MPTQNGKQPKPRHGNAVTQDETYGALRSENRVVMRHSIALNLDNFAAASDSFTPRPQRTHPPLKPARAPFFSVIVPNYNGLRHLPDLFEALDRQTFTDFEVILADDASSDDSVAWVEAHHPNARVLVNRHNQGFVATVNMAADAALGRVLVLLNNDTAPEPDFLKELALALCQAPDAAIVAAKLLLFDQPDRLHTAGDLFGRDGAPRNRGAWEEDRGQYDAQREVFGGCGGGMAVRREVWQALGGFDEDFQMYLEDADFSFRARLMGWRAVFASGARVRHKLGGSGGDELSSFYVGRNTIWTLVKNMPAGLLLRHAPAILAAQAQIATDALRHWRGAAARSRLRGQLAGLAGLPHILAKRRLIQARRVVGEEEIGKALV